MLLPYSSHGVLHRSITSMRISHCITRPRRDRQCFLIRPAEPGWQPRSASTPIRPRSTRTHLRTCVRGLLAWRAHRNGVCYGVRIEVDTWDRLARRSSRIVGRSNEGRNISSECSTGTSIRCRSVRGVSACGHLATSQVSIRWQRSGNFVCPLLKFRQGGHAGYLGRRGEHADCARRQVAQKTEGRHV
jgi:hypothetical protein